MPPPGYDRNSRRYAKLKMPDEISRLLRRLRFIFKAAIGPKVPGDVDVGIDPAWHHGVAAQVVIGSAARVRSHNLDFSILNSDADVVLQAALAVEQRACTQRDWFALRRGDARAKQKNCYPEFSHPLSLATSH